MLEEQLEFDFIKKRFDARDYLKKGLKYCSYTATALGLVALSPIIITGAFAYLVYDNVSNEDF